MTGSLSDYEQELLARNDKVVSALEKTSAVCDLNRQPPTDVWQAYIEAGLKGLLVSQDQGGRAASAAVMVRMSEALGAVDPIATLTFLPQEYCIAAVARYGQHPWQGEMLKAFMAGEESTGFLLTEPDAGSDATAITTLARKDSAGWRLNGVKAWVTNAPFIDEYFVFAQTEAGSGAGGIAGFLVPRKSRGVSVSEPYELLGGHVGSICDVTFDDVHLASERLVVPPGDGMRAALSAIDLARINVAAMCCGALATGLNIALEYTTSRQAFGQAIANFPRTAVATRGSRNGSSRGQINDIRGGNATRSARSGKHRGGAREKICHEGGAERTRYMHGAIGFEWTETRDHIAAFI